MPRFAQDARTWRSVIEASDSETGEESAFPAGWKQKCIVSSNSAWQDKSTLTQSHKIPVSTLIVIHTPDLQVLLLERADHPGFWQSVTGSKDSEAETLRDTAKREVREETGLDADQYKLTDWHKQTVYDIYPIWQHRYAPGTLHNTEHVFGLQLPTAQPIKIAQREHLAYVWLPYKQAAEKVFSQSNREAILELPARIETKVNQ